MECHCVDAHGIRSIVVSGAYLWCKCEGSNTGVAALKKGPSPLFLSLYESPPTAGAVVARVGVVRSFLRQLFYLS